MVDQRRRNMRIQRHLPTILSRDLLNLALVLAFLHIDPLGQASHHHNNSQPFSQQQQNSNPLHKHNIMDFYEPVLLSDRFLGQPPQEISAYILNTEIMDLGLQDLDENSSAVNNNTFNDNLLDGPNPGQGVQELMASDDSGVSDVDSGHQSGDELEDNLSIFQQPSPASTINLLDEDLNYDLLPGGVGTSLTNSAVNNTLDESSNIFRDLDDIIGASSASSALIKDELDYAPDEEDVENQLMHIDDRLIHLDENMGHLDEQLLNTNEVLMSVEEENFLFESMPAVVDSDMTMDMNSDSGGQVDAEIEELIAAGLPSPLMHSPFLTVDAEDAKELCPDENPVVKTEIKEEPSEQIVQEEPNTDWLEPFISSPPSPAESFASTNLPADLLASVNYFEDEEDDEEEDYTQSHLLDHNYALAAFDFGSETTSTSSFSPKTRSSSSSFDFYGGASALSGSTRESRDERKARELNLPFAVADIVDLPIDAYNELISRHTLTEAQMNLCKDIRRRGKNKVAAQNCRKRKMDLISQLEAEVSRARQQKQMLLAEREELYRMRNEWTHKLLNLESEVLRGLNKNVKDFTLDYSGASVKVTTRLAKAKA